MAIVLNQSDYIVKINKSLSTNKSNSIMSSFEWSRPLTNYENLESKSNTTIKQLLNRSLPRELLLYFHGNPINNTFSHLFNFKSSNIYVKPNSGNKLSKLAVGLMSVAIIFFIFALVVNLTGSAENTLSFFK